jgi:methionyl-tRNA formyltransferase
VGGVLARPHVFIGSYDKILAAMDQHLPVSTVIAPKGRLRNMRLEHRLRERGVNWLEVTGREEFMAAQAALPQPGYCSVSGLAWRIPQQLIDRSAAVFNFHPGDLLCCRGPDPIAAGLYHRHRELGACTHLIDSEDFDSGPLLERDLMPVSPGKGYNWHKLQLLQLLEQQADRLFAALARGDELCGKSWDVQASTWYPKLPKNILKALYTAPTMAGFQQKNPPA